MGFGFGFSMSVSILPHLDFIWDLGFWFWSFAVKAPTGSAGIINICVIAVMLYGCSHKLNRRAVVCSMACDANYENIHPSIYPSIIHCLIIFQKKARDFHNLSLAYHLSLLVWVQGSIYISCMKHTNFNKFISFRGEETAHIQKLCTKILGETCVHLLIGMAYNFASYVAHLMR